MWKCSWYGLRDTFQGPESTSPRKLTEERNTGPLQCFAAINHIHCQGTQKSTAGPNWRAEAHLQAAGPAVDINYPCRGSARCSAMVKQHGCWQSDIELPTQRQTAPKRHQKYLHLSNTCTYFFTTSSLSGTIRILQQVVFLAHIALRPSTGQQRWSWAFSCICRYIAFRDGHPYSLIAFTVLFPEAKKDATPSNDHVRLISKLWLSRKQACVPYYFHDRSQISRSIRSGRCST